MCAASLAIGQAAIGLCGARRWSWLAPAVGLALLCAVCWGTVRIGGDGVVSAIVVLVLTLGSIAYLWGGLQGGAGGRRGGGGGGVAGRRAGSADRAAGGLDPVCRRRPLRDPRHQLQPRHVTAPA